MTSIICADDDQYMRNLYRALFSTDKYSLRTFSNGVEVLDAYRDDTANLLILDIDMPGRSGLDVCRELRRSTDGFKVPIILVSGKDSEEDILRGLNAGANDYIVKPFKPPELLAKTATLLCRQETPSAMELGLPLGSRFVGRYEIVRRIGKGGFSTVYYANDVSVEPLKSTALKVFHLTPSKQNNEEFVALFLREAREHSKLGHPNIVTLYDFGSSEIYYYLAMEFLTGETLQDIITRERKLTEIEVVEIGYGVAKALEYLASSEMTHRDIKPANIMRTNDGTVKLLDFGLARHNKKQTVPMDTIFRGTLDFAAPESLRLHSEIDISADIFSLGAALYYSLTGIKPFRRNSMIELCNSPIEEQPTSGCDIDRSINPTLSGLIDNMLAPAPLDRPFIAEIRSTLENLLQCGSPNIRR